MNCWRPFIVNFKAKSGFFFSSPLLILILCTRMLFFCRCNGFYIYKTINIISKRASKNEQKSTLQIKYFLLFACVEEQTSIYTESIASPTLIQLFSRIQIWLRFATYNYNEGRRHVTAFSFSLSLSLSFSLLAIIDKNTYYISICILTIRCAYSAFGGYLVITVK
jgi:hypothetical protein